jgi:hypothetical protein
VHLSKKDSFVLKLSIQSFSGRIIGITFSSEIKKLKLRGPYASVEEIGKKRSPHE